MFARLLRDNPLGLLMLCASLVGTGYLVTYRLDQMEHSDAQIIAKLDSISSDVSEFKRDVSVDMASLNNSVTTKVFALDSSFTDKVNGVERDLNDKISNLNLKIALIGKDQENADN